MLLPDVPALSATPLWFPTPQGALFFNVTYGNATSPRRSKDGVFFFCFYEKKKKKSIFLHIMRSLTWIRAVFSSIVSKYLFFLCISKFFKNWRALNLFSTLFFPLGALDEDVLWSNRCEEGRWVLSLRDSPFLAPSRHINAPQQQTVWEARRLRDGNNLVFLWLWAQLNPHKHTHAHRALQAT